MKQFSDSKINQVPSDIFSKKIKLSNIKNFNGKQLWQLLKIYYETNWKMKQSLFYFFTFYFKCITKNLKIQQIFKKYKIILKQLKK